MKVILLQDVKALGKKGDVVNVSDGYARNAIFPKKLGVEANAKNLNDLKLQNQHADKVAQENYEAALAMAENLKDKKVTVKMKAGEGGRTFGSVSTKEISAAAKEQLGLELDKKKMQLAEPIRSFGVVEVPVKLHTKVTGKLAVHVVELQGGSHGEPLIKSSMPYSLDAEQSVIGSMIMDKDAILTAMEMLTSDDFYHKQYGILFDAMIELYSKGLPVDLITLQNKLKEKEVPEEISSLSYVKELLDAVPTSANIKYYAKIVKDNSMRRRLIRLNEEIENE